MSRASKVFITSIVLASIVGLLGDGDWWVLFLAGWGICDIVDSFWPRSALADTHHAGG